MKKFIFDVDGTLTPSRKKIDDSFKTYFYNFCTLNKVYLVTGSYRFKTVEQIGNDILDKVQLCFNCAGNEVWKGNDLISKETWEPQEDLISYLESILTSSKFNIRTGKHIEKRNGMVNFSIIGRNCNEFQRQEYIKWDKNNEERFHLSETISRKFNNVDCYIGGETGLDIFPKGFGKARAINQIRKSKHDILYYFGDQIFMHGNDQPAALLCDHYYNVRNWQATYEMLTYFDEAKVTSQQFY